MEHRQHAVAGPAARNERPLIHGQVPVVAARILPDALADAVIVPFHQNQDVVLGWAAGLLHDKILHGMDKRMQWKKTALFDTVNVVL
ncbi:MAG: hypothetical protein PHN34_14070 [Kiritimatiellae bacterium]|nr:hypothetical protein [Kiritimatiellia bacterium]